MQPGIRRGLFKLALVFIRQAHDVMGHACAVWHRPGSPALLRNMRQGPRSHTSRHIQQQLLCCSLLEMAKSLALFLALWS